MSEQTEVVRWYTRARKFPQLIGRTPDGAKLWGGPYTITQVLAAGGLLAVGLKTMRWWARYGLIGNALLLAAVTYAVVFALGRVPVGTRSPLSVAVGALQSFTASRTGRLGGRPVRLRRPHRVRHQAVVLRNAVPTPNLAAAPVPTPAPTPTGKVPAPVPGRAAGHKFGGGAAVQAAGPPLTGVQLMLARAATLSAADHQSPVDVDGGVR